MTETPSGHGARRLTHSTLLNVFATFAAHTEPPSRHLDEAITARAKAIAPDGLTPEAVRKAVEDVDHLQTIHDWCVANPERAACCVLAGLYLLNGRFVVQEQAGDTAQEGPA